VIQQIKNFLETTFFEKVILGVIILNAIVLGAETSPRLMAKHGDLLFALDRIFISIFVVELGLKLICYRLSFFRDPWKIFDLVVVGFALIPAAGSLSAMRAFRAFRLLRMISVLPQLKKVVTGLLNSIPSLGAVLSIMSIIFYVGAVVSTKLFGKAYPEWFGSIGSSAFSLFQVMTLESWSMGIARVVMQQYPYAWAFFIPFILLTTFTMLNLFVAVMVNSMQAESEANAQQRAEESHIERLEMIEDLKFIKAQLAEIKLKRRSESPINN
jgi:voltage-gated sodium channel